MGNEQKKEPKQRRAYKRKPVIEITDENFMDFSPRELYKEIEKLRKQNETVGTLKHKIKLLETRAASAVKTLTKGNVPEL